MTKKQFWDADSSGEHGAAAIIPPLQVLLRSAHPTLPDAKLREMAHLHLNAYRWYIDAAVFASDFEYQHLLASHGVLLVWQVHKERPLFRQEIAFLTGNPSHCFQLRDAIHATLSTALRESRAQMTINAATTLLKQDAHPLHNDPNLVQTFHVLTDFRYLGVKTHLPSEGPRNA